MHGIIIHGGCGEILASEISTALADRFREALSQAREAGWTVLERGGSSLDAVTSAILALEDCPLFNSAHGACLNAAGEAELDASIMDGRSLAAGAVTGVRHIRNPIRLARDVMERSSHVLMAGAGAEAFARELGYEMMPNEYFRTAFRIAQQARVREWEAAQAAPSGADGRPHATSFSADDNVLFRELNFGTVGAAALDQAGHLAAGTSTGGMMNKRFGRVGDSPIIGAGTYANDATCAVSGTGWGEYFMRVNAAHEVSARMEHGRASLAAAASGAIARVGDIGGKGGLIAIDRAGNVAMPFNAPGMYRAHQVAGKTPFVGIFAA